MKKTLLLTLALGLAGAPSLVAGNVDVYIVGATAFRANVYTACQRLFTTGIGTTVYYGDATHGGSGSSFNSKTAAWAMTGTPISGLTNLGANSLTLHAFFTGSIQGIQTVGSSTKLVFPNADGTGGGNCATYSTNSPTIGFSDASGVATPYPATGNFVEEQVCVQPFVVVKSTATVGAVTNINNITWEQLEYGISPGRIPLSTWTSKVTDTNTFVYLMERTKDSGTRRNETAGNYYQYNDTVGIYIYDFTNNFFYTPSVTANSSYGFSPNGVIGTEGPGLNNANMNWGYGYIGGGDIANTLNNNNSKNQAIAYLSIADAKSVGSSSSWGKVISVNGLWPTAAGSGINGNTGTNDYSPITLGYYPCWGLEVLVHPVDPSLVTTRDQNITQTQLGDQTTPGSFMGVFNAQTLINGGSPLAGSIENEIELSKTGSPGATAIRLSDMYNSRAAVGGTISPPFN
jgi:hypothetical protein